ncbi:MAG: hypothetical protein JXA60_10805 [Candidatus Coatesbacteria bacterium]|nr:hypothetical protein [Candidatus Coatesbacteria bacterium]
MRIILLLSGLIFFIQSISCNKMTKKEAKVISTDKSVKEYKMEGGFFERGPVMTSDKGKPVKHGIWKVYFPDKKLYATGKYYNGKKDSLWTIFTKDGKKSEEANFRQDIQDGPYKSWYDGDKLKSKGMFKKGKPYSIWELYYLNGNLESKGSYYYGKKQDKWIYYYANSQLRATGNFKDDFPVGEWTGKDSLGISFKATFPVGNGEVSGTYENKKKFISMIIKNRQLIGKAVFYYSNGKAERSAVYIELSKEDAKKEGFKAKLVPFFVHNMQKNFDGVPDGQMIRYYTNGQIERLTTFRRGILTGQHKQFYENGKKKVECIYKEGKIVKDSFTSWDINGKVLEKK